MSVKQLKNKKYGRYWDLFLNVTDYLKHIFIITIDAHNYKITGMLKQLKF